MKKLVFFGAVIIFLLGLSRLASAQVSPTMYTLDDIYYYLANGTTATAGGHSLDPPREAIGGDIRFKTLKQIYDLANAEFEKCDATAVDVREGYQFYSVEPGSWGVRTGARSILRYDLYGPDGTNDVIQIGSMYVASKKDGVGCANGNTMDWTEAQNWADGLSWLVTTGRKWRLPTSSECELICDNKDKLYSWTHGVYWTSDPFPAPTPPVTPAPPPIPPWGGYAVAFGEEYTFECVAQSSSMESKYYVRVVLDVP